MQFEREDNDHSRIATIDIETTHYKPSEGETVSIGLGVHERGTHGKDANYQTLHRSGDDEADLIRHAFSELDRSEADLLVSYKGRDFDMDFLQKRLGHLNESADIPSLHTKSTHLDLYEDRLERCERTGEKWPSLEECLESYGYSPAKTLWDGSEVTNVRFGEELGPAYLRTLSEGTGTDEASLQKIIEHYLLTDLEANITLYYSDIGGEFVPMYDGAHAEF